MSARNDGGPAFPREDYQTNGAPKDQPFYLGQEGMSLRDYFAAQALNGDIAGNWRDNNYKPQGGLSIIENVARAAYQFADAMLKAREA